MQYCQELQVMSKWHAEIVPKKNQNVSNTQIGPLGVEGEKEEEEKKGKDFVLETRERWLEGGKICEGKMRNVE